MLDYKDPNTGNYLGFDETVGAGGMYYFHINTWRSSECINGNKEYDRTNVE